jgi:hypothetical protein
MLGLFVVLDAAYKGTNQNQKHINFVNPRYEEEGKMDLIGAAASGSK